MYSFTLYVSCFPPIFFVRCRSLSSSLPPPNLVYSVPRVIAFHGFTLFFTPVCLCVSRLPCHSSHLTHLTCLHGPFLLPSHCTAPVIISARSLPWLTFSTPIFTIISTPSPCFSLLSFLHTLYFPSPICRDAIASSYTPCTPSPIP